jgi:PTH1 family peptidyl-tRNA hydrolase
MNRSGDAAVAALGFYKVKTGDIIVIHDDLDLKFGIIRTKNDGGHGGHNGIRDISQKLGTKEYTRIKIGIKSEMKDVMGASNFVLGRFTKDEQADLPQIIEEAENKMKEALKKKNE